MNSDDCVLYHSDGTPYWDGDPVDANGLFTANGKPARFGDFVQRYWSDPPPEWAKQFEEYATWSPSPRRWLDLEQASAERLLADGGKSPNAKIAAKLATLKGFVPPQHRYMLDEIEVLFYGLPTLNGYASLNPLGHRCIVLHAGVVLSLTYLGTFISRVLSPRANRAQLSISLSELADYIGSGGSRGILKGALEPTLPGTMEDAHAGLTSLKAAMIRDMQLTWIVAHECAHHLCGHLESLQRDITRCSYRPDVEHMALRRKYELEADRAATDLVRRADVDLGQVIILFMFLMFTDEVLNVQYDEMSTHPITSSRLEALRHHIADAVTEQDWRIEEWQGFLVQASAAYKLNRRARPRSVSLQCPPEFLR